MKLSDNRRQCRLAQEADARRPWHDSGKGQTARSGVRINGGEGGQMPLYRRLPKRGFNNIFRVDFAEINLDRLQDAIDAKLIDAGDTITADSLAKAKIVRRPKDGVRLARPRRAQGQADDQGSRHFEIRHRVGRESGRLGEDPGVGKEGRRRGGVTSASSRLPAAGIRVT
jgi:hypothetical protein